MDAGETIHRCPQKACGEVARCRKNICRDTGGFLCPKKHPFCLAWSEVPGNIRQESSTRTFEAYPSSLCKGSTETEGPARHGIGSKRQECGAVTALTRCRIQEISSRHALLGRRIKT